MPTMENKELKSKLSQLKADNDQIVAAADITTIEVEVDGKKESVRNVEVKQDDADRFRKNTEEMKEIKSWMDAISADAEIRAWMDEPESKSTSVAAEAMAHILANGNHGGRDFTEAEFKTVGELFLASPEFAELKASGGANMQNRWEIEAEIGAGALPVERKSIEGKDIYTAMPNTQLTTLGFGRSQRDPFIPQRMRRQRVRDLFPVAQTTANLIDFIRVSGFTNNASVVPERDAGQFAIKPHSAIQFTAAQAPVRTIAHWEAAHRNVLADEPMLRSVIDNELLYGLRLQEDYQIIQGTGLGEDLLGVLNVDGTQSYAHGDSGVATDQMADDIRRAATKVLLAYYEPTGVVVHPNDWEAIELLKDNEERYLIATSVTIGAQQQLWRQPVVDTPAMPEGTFVEGAWGLGAQIYDRMQSNIRISEHHADFFIRNAIVVLAEQRLALAWKRPESFVIGTFE